MVRACGPLLADSLCRVVPHNLVDSSSLLAEKLHNVETVAHNVAAARLLMFLGARG